MVFRSSNNSHLFTPSRASLFYLSFLTILIFGCGDDEKPSETQGPIMFGPGSGGAMEGGNIDIGDETGGLPVLF